MASVSLMWPRGRQCFFLGVNRFFQRCKFGILSIVKSHVFLLEYYYVCIVLCSVAFVHVVVDGGGGSQKL